MAKLSELEVDEAEFKRILKLLANTAGGYVSSTGAGTSAKDGKEALPTYEQMNRIEMKLDEIAYLLEDIKENTSPKNPT